MRNTFLKSKLQTGQTSIGTWIYVAHPDVSEILAQQGFDWLLFDLEHGSLSIETIQRMLQPMNGTDTAAIVRVPGDQPTLVGQALDCGAHGIVFPMINSRSQAEMAVRACRYPPLGSRGLGPRRCTGYGKYELEYLETANEQLLIAMQIETTEAISQIDDILSVDGVDVALIGSGDLSAQMGCLLEFDNPKLVQAFHTVLEACHRHNVIPGIAYTSNADSAAEFVKQGFRFIGIGSDDYFLIEGARATVERFKGSA